MRIIKFYATLALLFLGAAAWAQKNESAKSDSTGVTKKVKDKRLARSVFAGDQLMDIQTTENLKKEQLEFMIQHRFGSFANGIQDLYGLYGSANIRIGLDYGIIDRVQVGYGITKDNLQSDGHVKVAILQQTRSNAMPVSLSYYGQAVIAGEKDPVQFPHVVDRFSYFHQIILSRKFADWCSLELAPSFAHYNIVEAGSGTVHDNFAVSLAGRFKISSQSSVIFEFDCPITNFGAPSKSYSDSTTKSYPNLEIGWEITTGSHVFQIILGTANGILPQQIMVYNGNDFTKPKTGWMLGFNISRKWGFTGKKK